MSKSLDQFQQRRDVLLRDAAGKLPAGDRDALLDQAILQRYSVDRPREMVTDLASDGTGYLAMPAPSGAVFEDGFSILHSLEYPLAQLPPQFLLQEEWQLYRAPAGLKILLLLATPAIGETVRAAWTARHISDGSTVADADFEAVCQFAAALCYEALAGIYAQTGDPNTQADVVNYRSKSQEYLSLAKSMAKHYFDHIGVSQDSAGAQTLPALATGSVYETLGMGFDRLTHPRSSR
jgi:hypothetical protein